MDASRYFAGNMLLAMPGIGDVNFNHSVIALCVHDEHGAFGLDLGGEMEGVTLHTLFEQFDVDATHVPDRPLLRGGPVEPKRGFVLHSLDWGGQDMVAVGGQWGLSGSLDILKAIAAGTGPSRYIVALGYAGWAPGQLENEMVHHGWFVAPATDALLFDTPAEARWATAFASSGVDARMIAVEGGTA